MLCSEAIPDALHPEILPPFLRVLLTTDGTVTRSLEAYFWEPISVDVLDNDVVRSARDYPEIGIERGQLIILRRVILCGHLKQVPYAFAQSVIAVDRLAPQLRRELLEERTGIGEVLIRTKQKTFREVLSVRRVEACAWATALKIDPREHVVVRQYTIDHDLGPSILIEEVFPKCRYERADRYC